MSHCIKSVITDPTVKSSNHTPTHFGKNHKGRCDDGDVEERDCELPAFAEEKVAAKPYIEPSKACGRDEGNEK